MRLLKNYTKNSLRKERNAKTTDRDMMHVSY